MTRPATATRRPLRLIHAAGPGDVVGTFRHWSNNRDDPSQVAMTYSGLFFDTCRDLNAQTWVIASHPRKDLLEAGPFRVEHRPQHYRSGPTIPYLLEQWTWGLRLVLSAIRFRADALILSTGMCNPLPLRILPLLGIPIIPSVHCVLWRKNRPPRGLRWKLTRFASGTFFQRAAAILSASSEITRQLHHLTAGQLPPVIPFLPSYRRETFSPLTDPPTPRSPFRVLYAGRIEPNKGVFQLLHIAQQFARQRPNQIHFDLCGAGSALPELRHQAALADLADSFRCLGHCDRPTMRDMFRLCHVVIVPTTTDFIEGFNQVVAEGVLAGRPVITSSVCPALEYVRPAVLEVPPDDTAAYADAILRLYDDPILYEKTRRASSIAAQQFYDYSRNWSAALKSALALTHLTPPPAQSETTPPTTALNKATP